MKHSLFTLCLSLTLFLNLYCYAQEHPVLEFDKKNRFKIVQFTDLHIQYDSFRSDSVINMMREIVKKESPDLVVLTGDVVGSSNRKKAWLKVAQVMIDAKTPWSAILGNHDAEFEIDKKQTMEAIIGLPYNMTQYGPHELPGAGNYVLPIQSSSSNAISALCYFFDSVVEGEPGHNKAMNSWLDPSILNWYRQQSESFTSKNNNKPYPSLAFIHIPLPEFKKITNSSLKYGIGQDVGENIEKTKRARHSNIYQAFLESKDVMGVFAGHEHNNNYIVCPDGIALGYGQTSGRQVYGNLGAGARVIQLYEGKREFDSWLIKYYDNNREADFWYPTYNYDALYHVQYPHTFNDGVDNSKIQLISMANGRVSMRLMGKGKATIDWGDGTVIDHFEMNGDQMKELTHEYNDQGPRKIRIVSQEITKLNCQGMQLTQIFLANAPELTELDCSNNRIWDLDINNNSALKVLWCNNNQLSFLNLEHNPLLTQLFCYQNNLHELKLHKQSELVWLNCYQNRLSNLDLSHNSKLSRIDCYRNRLSNLDLSHNRALYWVLVNDNQFTSRSLNDLFASLATQTLDRSKKIYISGNVGEVDCDKNIAITRSWQVGERY
ncbi:metallophosphoesterase [Sphingobacterium hotanense]|uniref:metallophosphoesterase n=1 Tax=Sphingobacterium hotanense TaxID=649196 RepID=UPI001659EBD8|nr:metallophosphoesterase [Sphingobacterium hotanense]